MIDTKPKGLALTFDDVLRLNGINVTCGTLFLVGQKVIHPVTGAKMLIDRELLPSEYEAAVDWMRELYKAAPTCEALKHSATLTYSPPPVPA